MKKNKISRPRIIYGIITVVVMVCIYLFSCENADKSSDTSGRFVNLIISLFYGDYDDMTSAEQEIIRGNISHLIRKTAHFVIYAALGFFAFLTSGQKRMICRGTLLTLLFCGLYAVTDEIHQHFVPGRACMIRDMLLDTCGSLTGITVSFVLTRIFQRKKVT